LKRKIPTQTLKKTCCDRLEETCRQLQSAARVMGNTALFAQMEAASAAIKRDVIFAASLYVA
jgi:antiviral helicase SKI2